MPPIRILPDLLVNQIAAGEVIERPASVVKELLENALDAGGLTIRVDVEGGGRRRIRLSDDGHGMGRDDALLALERHATSKLTPQSDLRRIDTLGFRGEALPAIASVSRLTLTTSTGEGVGTRVLVEGGKIRDVSPTGHPRGTTVDVSDLFFNTPARAKFLRSSATEMGHVADLVAAYGIALPGVRLSLFHDGRKVLDSPAIDDLGERLRHIQGDLWAEAIPFDSAGGGETRSTPRVHGRLALPSRSGSTRRHQRIYVNGRLVRDRQIAHAIAAATSDYFPKDRHAALVLFIECPPDLVDVNVHPAKSEVRFRDGRAIHDLVAATVGRALTSTVPITSFAPGRTALPADAGRVEEARYWSRTLGEPSTSANRQPPDDHRGEPAVPSPLRPGLFEGAGALAQYRQSYILAEDEQGLLMIDQHAAHERILFERLRERTRESRPEPQGLLFPVTVTVPRVLAERLKEILPRLSRLGIEAEVFGDRTIMVRSVPAILPTGGEERLVGDLLDQMAEDDAGDDRPGGIEPLLATIACHAAIKVRMPLTREKMSHILEQLFQTASPLKCPHGRPAVLRYAHREIERGFGRP